MLYLTLVIAESNIRKQNIVVIDGQEKGKVSAINLSNPTLLKQKKLILRLAFFCDPAGIRTQDPYIKSVLLYQLSYGILLLYF